MLSLIRDANIPAINGPTLTLHAKISPKIWVNLKTQVVTKYFLFISPRVLSRKNIYNQPKSRDKTKRDYAF